jgi:pseudouridine synthase
MIAQACELSRRAAEKAILSGRVTVNGRIISILGTKVNPKADHVCIDGRPVNLPERFFYLAYNKPCGLLVTKEDPHGRPTIWDRLPKWKKLLNSAGRLDLNSEGLLILTNDGAMINALTHPRHIVSKVYEVKVRGVPTASDIERLRSGIKLEEGRTRPAKVRVLDSEKKCSLLEISIEEGRKRQVRRMCQAVGHPVIRLKRVAVGPIKLAGLKPGAWRHLNQEEISAIRGEAYA